MFRKWNEFYSVLADETPLVAGILRVQHSACAPPEAGGRCIRQIELIVPEAIKERPGDSQTRFSSFCRSEA
jgi:hypothetical protein